jgi:hypothetical protein
MSFLSEERVFEDFVGQRSVSNFSVYRHLQPLRWIDQDFMIALCISMKLPASLFEVSSNVTGEIGHRRTPYSNRSTDCESLSKALSARPQFRRCK